MINQFIKLFDYAVEMKAFVCVKIRRQDAADQQCQIVIMVAVVWTSLNIVWSFLLTLFFLLRYVWNVGWKRILIYNKRDKWLMINYYLLINLLSYTSCGYFILTEKVLNKKEIKMWLSKSILGISQVFGREEVFLNSKSVWL